MACCGGNKKKPTVRRVVVNAAEAAAKVAASIAAGKKIIVDKDVREKRLSACMACEHLDGRRCLRCGCFIFAKTWLRTEECPDWPPA